LELVKILRELSRRRRLVAIVLGFSLIVGLLLAFKPGLPPRSRQYVVHRSSADVLIDTRDSQVVTVNGRGPDLPTLAGRANLIGNLMTGGRLKEAIASAAGVPSELLTVVPPGNAATPGVAPLPVKSPASIGLSEAESTILSLSTDETLPILHIVVQAPDEATARALTTAAVSELKKYLGSVAAAQKIPAVHQLVLRELGAPVAETAIRGLPRKYALIATLVLALLGCAAIVGGSWFIRSWQQVAEAERHGHPDASHPEGPEDDDQAPAGNGNGNAAGWPSKAQSPGLRFPALATLRATPGTDDDSRP
jgi:hypothetical protein